MIKEELCASGIDSRQFISINFENMNNAHLCAATALHDEIIRQASENTIVREFGVYDRMRDNFPKYVVTLDEFDMSRNGIKHRNIRDFPAKMYGRCQG